jgi:hypothetical protein
MTKDRLTPDSETSGKAAPPKRSAGEPWRERSRGQSEGVKRRVSLPSAEQVTASLENIHIIDHDGLFKKWPTKKDGPAQQEEKKDEGRLNEPLLRYLKAKKIPPEMWSDTAAEIERVITKKLAAAVKRPRWDDRAKYPELQFLPAPEFLKRVWADQIGPKGEVDKTLIRQIDRPLIKTVEAYVANRQRRNRDAGQVKGLRLLSRAKGPPGVE